MGSVKIERDRDWVWVYFPGKPDKTARNVLVSLGGRWSRKRGGWYFTNGDTTEPKVRRFLNSYNVTYSAKKASKYERFEDAYNKAMAAGKKAGKNVVPTPMIVSEAEGLSNRPKKDGKSWFVSEGVCGEGWVNIRPGTSSLARWLKREKGARKAYRGGVNVYAPFGQSLARNRKWARVFADTLKEELNTECQIWARSRID